MIPWTYVIDNFNGKETIKILGQKKGLKEKETNFMSNGKVMMLYNVMEMILYKNESILS